MVNLASERVTAPIRKKSLASTQADTFSNSKSLRLSDADKASSPTSNDGGTAELGGGAARTGIHTPKPHYPFASRQLREQGLVIVKLCVNELGIVDEVGISKSSGFQSLDQSALSALAQWRFSAVTSAPRTPLQQCFRTPIQFTLEG